MKLFLFPHYDDEVFVSRQLSRIAPTDEPLGCCYLSRSAVSTQDTLRRRGETLRYLRRLGIGEERAWHFGIDDDVPDGAIRRHLLTLFDRLRATIASQPSSPLQIVAPLWEGGHPDHDAVHFLAVLLEASLGLEPTLFYPMYSGHRTRGKWFEVAGTPPSGAQATVAAREPLSLLQAVLVAVGPLVYFPSQRRTWMMLSPFLLKSRLASRAEVLYFCSGGVGRCFEPPHPVPLLYERHERCRWHDMREAIVAAAARVQVSRA